ncbi:MAG TPA: hypothetical protein VFB56_04420 [Nitrospiraceae bacterium]|nr:hypothetical protein [Nitrospiraceae bacterium]
MPYYEGFKAFVHIDSHPLLIFPFTVVAEDQFGTPRGDEGTRIFKATEHQNYSGHFRILGRQTTTHRNRGDPIVAVNFVAFDDLNLTKWGNYD